MRNRGAAARADSKNPNQASVPPSQSSPRCPPGPGKTADNCPSLQSDGTLAAWLPGLETRYPTSCSHWNSEAAREVGSEARTFADQVSLPSKPIENEPNIPGVRETAASSRSWSCVAVVSVLEAKASWRKTNRTMFRHRGRHHRR
jgi:hypothetical protein